MRVGGLHKVSLIDYPGQISAVIFTQGCNFRCAYCHNPDLVDPVRHRAPLDLNDIFAFLDHRRGKLDAITITGGEPTLQEDLEAFIRDIRRMGYLIKLDTNGSRPEILKPLIEAGILDYVAMDIKTCLKKYRDATRAAADPEKIRESIDIIMASGIDYEFRTTAVPSVTTLEDFLALAGDIKNSRRYVLQTFIPANTLDGALIEQKPFTRDEMQAIKESVERFVSCVVIR